MDLAPWCSTKVISVNDGAAGKMITDQVVGSVSVNVNADAVNVNDH